MNVVIEKSEVPLPGLAIGLPLVIPEGSRIRDLLGRAVADEGELYLLPAVNGKSTNLDRVLRDGDRLRIFRLSAGG